MKPRRIEPAPPTGNPALDAWLDQLVSLINQERPRIPYSFHSTTPGTADNASRGFDRGHFWFVPITPPVE